MIWYDMIWYDMIWYNTCLLSFELKPAAFRICYFSTKLDIPHSKQWSIPIYIYSDMFEYIRNQVSLGPGHVLIHPEYYDAHRVEKRQFKMSILMIHTPGTIPFKMDFQDFKPTSTTNYWARYKVLSPLQKKVKRLDSCMVHRIFTYIWLICMVNVRNIPVPWILSEML